MIYLKLIWCYLRIGLFGFGGGYAMLALIERLVVGPGWITPQVFTDIVAVSQMTPGPIGINSATYIGYVAPALSGYPGVGYGLLGSVICTLTVVLPSSLLVLYASHYIRRHRQSAVVQGILRGLRPIVVGLIASAALLLMNGANFGTDTYQITASIAICVAAFAMVYYAKMRPMKVIVLAGVAGLILF